MRAARRYLAFDLGAESGRAIVGLLEGGKMGLDVLHRFPNTPVRVGDTIYWDVLGMFREMKTSLAAYAAKYGRDLAGVAADSWGVDFGLLDRDGALLGNPVHYRDARNDGMTEALSRAVPLSRVYARTGIQIMQINTLFQLFSMVKSRSPILDRARSMLCIADLYNYFLCGEKRQEYTLATTTQMYDPFRKRWDAGLLRKLRIPARMLPEIVPPGSAVGRLHRSISEEAGVKACRVIATASHDTAAAVAAVPAKGADWLYLSSGTWSLLGAELPGPLVNDRTRDLNFTNEGGVCDTIRFLKNISGMWIVQQCRQTWARQGDEYDYAALARMAQAAPPMKRLIDPDNPSFAAPGDMPSRIVRFCRKTRQSVPRTHGEFVRAALESLALRYRYTVEAIEELTGRRYNVLHIVGGGSQNDLLNQFAADATGKLVRTGPVEATALGNCLMQAIALGDVRSLAEAREIVRNSVEMGTYEPSADRSRWDEAYAKFRTLLD